MRRQRREPLRPWGNVRGRVLPAEHGRVRVDRRLRLRRTLRRGRMPRSVRRDAGVRERDDLVKNLDTGYELVIDARPAGRFTGAEPEPRRRPFD